MSENKEIINKEEKEPFEDIWKRIESITIDELPIFLKDLFNQALTYDSCVRFNAIAMFAAYNAVNNFKPQYGLTGFQAGCLQWMIIEKMKLFKPPMTILEYRNMLYPQYEYKFTTISSDIWKLLQKEVTELLENKEKDLIHPDVWNHWESIKNGKIPFGYIIKER